MIEDGLVALINSFALEGIQGAPYPVILPEGAALPAMTYQFAGNRSSPTFDTSGPQRLRVQFDIFSLTARPGRLIRSQLVSSLNEYTGHLADGTDLQYAEYIQPIDHFENGPRQFRCAVEFYLYFNFSS